ncbi:MAG: alpha-N-arabinofuranosidase, partial [Spirochaetota bacterium]
MNHRIIVHADTQKARIDKNIYGHFAEHLGRCIYDGIWVGEDSSIPNVRGIRTDIVEALKRIKAPIVRWPGGCFADEYHWKDGVGAPEKRKRIVNSNWAGVVEDNRFGTHEFMDFCRQIGAEPYICGNVGSGTVQEMQEWIEYVNSADSSPMADWRRENGQDAPFGLKYFGVGNENWGCGGNMRPEYYADLYKRYNTFARTYGDAKLYRVACGPRGADYTWTDVLMREAGNFMDGLALHYYSRSFPTGSNRDFPRGSATQFDEDMWALILRKAHDTEELVSRHGAIMDRYDPGKRVALIVDEWGTWFEEEPGTKLDFLFQQNTMRDALVASISLNIFNNHADRVRMANIAQTVNVLQAMVLTDGPTMVLTPTFHVFELYSGHQNAMLLSADVQTDQYEYDDLSMDRISASASRSEDGSILVTLNNADPNEPATVECVLRGAVPKVSEARVLTAPKMNAHNTFTDPDQVVPVDFTDHRAEKDTVTMTVPP